MTDFVKSVSLQEVETKTEAECHAPIEEDADFRGPATIDDEWFDVHGAIIDELFMGDAGIAGLLAGVDELLVLGTKTKDRQTMRSFMQETARFIHAMIKIFFLIAALLASPLSVLAEKIVLRVGHFPNITHAQGVIGHGLSRQGKGWFEQRLGTNVQVQWFVYNAGPSAMEAVFAKSIDISYVGPNPAINAHLKSRGDEIRIVAGACSGGAALVVQSDGRIKTDADFKGKKVATPQLGNTQDVAARAWLLSKKFRVTLTGGDVLVIPTANPDQLALFEKGEMDAVWTVEPWVSRLVLEAKGKVFLDESSLWPETGGKYVTTHLVSSVKFLNGRQEVLRKWIAAHVELTEWINKNPNEAKKILNDEIKAETTKSLPQQTLNSAWKRLELTHDPVRVSLLKSAEDAHRIGFTKEKPDLSRIYDLTFLNDVLREKRLSETR